MRSLHSWFGVSLLAICAMQLGCGGADRPPLGYVSGLVSMDGEPVADIIVVMKPENGRPAMVRSDKSGQYEIEYTKGEKGTKLGPTTVSLEWPLGGGGGISIPKKYVGDQSELKLDVKKGKQTFNIEMTSETADTPKADLRNKAKGAGQPVD